MGSSFGCVKQLRDAGPGGAAPLSPKRKLRFRRKRKAKQKLKGAEGEDKRSRVLEEKESGSVEVTEESTTRAPDSVKLVSGQITTETETPTNVVLVPGMAPIFGSTGTLRGSKMAILSPDPSPAWLGALRPFEVEGLSEETPELEQSNTTPGGGRVCKVRERVQGVLERPCLLRSKRGDLEIEKEGGDVHGQSVLMFMRPLKPRRRELFTFVSLEGNFVWSELCIQGTMGHPSGMKKNLRSILNLQLHLLLLEALRKYKCPQLKADHPGRTTLPNQQQLQLGKKGKSYYWTTLLK